MSETAKAHPLKISKLQNPNSNLVNAPGWPGIPARWTSSAKTGIGTALSSASRVWFTHSHGILNEIYFPEVDRACTRDMELIVTNGHDFFSEEKRDTSSEMLHEEGGLPSAHFLNTCKQGRYSINKRIVADPLHDTVLQHIVFKALVGRPEDYHLYVLLSPHLGNFGAGNTGWVTEYAGVPMLCAERDGTALALACSSGFLKRSVGFVGTSDGWQDLKQNFQMTWTYQHAENGNVALTAEIDHLPPAGDFVLSLGFGETWGESCSEALAGIKRGFGGIAEDHTQRWRDWQEDLFPLDEKSTDGRHLYRISAAVLRTCESKVHPGGIIASLSIPWGFSKGDDDLGGYHLVWPRDLVECAGALLAAGAHDDVRRVLDYLKQTQAPDGHWPQNMWLDGEPYWSGIQMDETAFPILLVDLARRFEVLSSEDLSVFWPVVRRAALYLLINGPVTQQDRWEEDAGFSPFTLAVEVSALLTAAGFAEAHDDPYLAQYLTETADFWNSSLERWTYVLSTDLASQYGIEGYYVRIAPPDSCEASSPAGGFVSIKNRPPGSSVESTSTIVSPDALALVRFGLRSPDDPRIVNTVKLIDALLKVETPTGPAWHRYNDDGYGEHEDGSPFDGTGIGRAWPLMTGERAHYELAAGRTDVARRLMKTLASFANSGGMISEQIWDAPDIPESELYFGMPSGSAMPLAWAHAEYVKLLRSLKDGHVFDMPECTQERYLRKRVDSPLAVWRFNLKCTKMQIGKTLRIETLASAVIHWSDDEWRTVRDTPTRDSGFGLHLVDLPTSSLPVGAIVRFTFFWDTAGKWEGKDFAVAIAP